jgi:hypothetical protein
MRHERVTDAAKGWLAGPWDSDLPVSLGFANRGLDEPHVHTQIAEIYLVARGTAARRRSGSSARRSSSGQAAS